MGHKWTKRHGFQQFIYLTLILYIGYCWDYSVLIVHLICGGFFYFSFLSIYPLLSCLPKWSLSISLPVTAHHYQCEWVEGACVIYMGLTFGTWFIMSHCQIKNLHWYLFFDLLFIYQYNTRTVGIENIWIKMDLSVCCNPLNPFRIKTQSQFFLT